ncbi:4-hydroxy-3-methylbut-2-enyl diphosphate reductase [bacterium]|nr:4-hydroxy-3-methylbut-2-enyl diphosphate reductase [bacterium]
MKIIRATHLGMCFGVRDAITLARRTAAQQSVTVLGQLVHNQGVLEQLHREGVRFAESPDEVRTDAIMITAHGASDKRLTAARLTGKKVIEATCPLVHYAHRELRMLLVTGYHPVIIGQRGHVEVNGLTEDLDECDIILTEDDVAQMIERPKFGVVAQTTQPIDRVRRLTDSLRRRFPKSEVLLQDTVCRPTKERQQAAVDLAQQCEVVVVIGGSNSNNTRELVQTCLKHCKRVHHIQSSAQLEENWFSADDIVGITAGTSTPDWIIDGVVQALKSLEQKVTSSTELAAAAH